MKEQFETIVVGAGVAGLTCARLLAAEGQRVVVLEARDRIGGRLHTLRENGRIIDHGASWIHGIDDCPLYDVARGFDMKMLEFTMGSYQPDGRPLAYYGVDGELLDDAAQAAFVADVKEVSALLPETVDRTRPGTSFAEAAEDAIAQAGLGGSRADRVREYLHHRSEEQVGAEARDLDAHGLDDDDIDGDEVVFPGGYDELAARLADGLDVRLSHEVTRVEWSEGGATVAAGDAVYTADRTVVTVPVGVLKRGAIAFDPPLPEQVADALDGLEMNAFEKVFLRFTEPFWQQEQRGTQSLYGLRRQGPAARQWHGWYDLTAMSGEPTLLTFAAGDWAREIRDWSDERIVHSVLESLREIFGVAVTAPVHHHITRWQDDPYAHGAYSYMAVGSRIEDHDDLATPLAGGALQIAGEATSSGHSATVDGAMMSGHRAASRILGHEPSFDTLVAPVAP